MIHLVILGELKKENRFQMVKKDFETKILKGKPFDPDILYNMASALYGLGTDIGAGDFKDLDLDTYFITTNLKDNFLIILGIDKDKKYNKKIKKLKKNFDIIHQFIKEKAFSTENIETFNVDFLNKILKEKTGLNLDISEYKII